MEDFAGIQLLCVTQVDSWPTFSIERQIIHILAFVGHMVSVTATQFYSFSRKTSIDSNQTNQYGFPIKLYLQKINGWPGTTVCQLLWSFGSLFLWRKI